LAFDLKAVIRIVDNATAPLKRIQRQAQQLQRTTEQVRRSTELWRDANGRLRDSMGRFAAETRKANFNLKQLGNGLRSTGGFVRGLTGQFTALAAAVGGAVAAKNIFESTVWEAAKFENSQVVIRAMFDDRKAAESYMKMLERFAVDSPVLNSQDMFENSKSFIATSKNIKQLEKMWNLAERLVALDPAQGVSGAVLALKEFFSGDVVSLVERFELPRAELKAIKDLPLDQKLKELDKFFNKLGATNKLVKEMGGTTIGLWNRVREQFAILLREMGRPSLEVLSGFFTQIIQKLESGELNRFAEVGGRMIKGILTGLTNGAISIYNWFTSLSNSEEFKRRTTIFGKVKFVIEDIYNRFLKWLDSGGRDKITATVSSLIQILTAAIESSMKFIVPVAIKIGAAIGKGVLDGFNEAVKDSLVLQLLGSPQDNAQLAKKKIIEWGAKKIWNIVKGDDSKKPKGHYHGLSYVPYDGYTASLHRGERILTAKENREYTRGGGGAKSVVITGNTFVVREEADIRKIAGQLADLLAEAGANGA
jgi:hypothetical protein